MDSIYQCYAVSPSGKCKGQVRARDEKQAAARFREIHKLGPEWNVTVDAEPVFKPKGGR